MDKAILNDAIIFATEAHERQKRKGTDMPYIVHPLEVMTICLGITDKTELLVACLLHDTIEDAVVTKEEIAQRFGSRVAELVVAESEEKDYEDKTVEGWKKRKQKMINELHVCTDVDIKIVAFCDKLANLRAIYRDKKQIGNTIWQRFNVNDPVLHKWYYATILESCAELADTDAYIEYAELLNKLFGEQKKIKL